MTAAVLPEPHQAPSTGALPAQALPARWSVDSRVRGATTWHHGGPLFNTEEDATTAAKNSVGPRLEWRVRPSVSPSGHKTAPYGVPSTDRNPLALPREMVLHADLPKVARTADTLGLLRTSAKHFREV